MVGQGNGGPKHQDEGWVAALGDLTQGVGVDLSAQQHLGQQCRPVKGSKCLPQAAHPTQHQVLGGCKAAPPGGELPAGVCAVGFGVRTSLPLCPWGVWQHGGWGATMVLTVAVHLCRLCKL
jgi:hypothetical protein